MKAIEHVEELPTSSDLSMSALVFAVEKLPKGRFTHYIIECASQNMGVAFPLATALGDVSIEMNIEYEPDEWSVKMYKVEGDEYHVYRVHTDGA